MSIRLSPSTLSLYKECPRCFWLQMNERVARPRGIFPSLPGGMDLVIKDYFDKYRGALPPELEGKVEGTLLDDSAVLERWRNWRTGLSWRDEELDATLFGALDDCLVLPNGLFAPLDYKTRGFPPKEGGSEEYYQHQLDAYALLLQENGYSSADVAYLVYYYPKEVRENGLVQFAVEPHRMQIDKERAKKLFTDAVLLLRDGKPEFHRESTTCEYCLWHTSVGEFDA